MLSASPSLPFTIAVFLATIGALVVFHELGHYSVGRLFGVRAEAFSVGFGREVVGWTDRRGTRWKIAWLPLGGYVRFAGDMNPASVPTHNSAPAEPGTFQAATLWQRALIVFAGPAVNFVLAALIYLGVFATIGIPHTPPIITGVLSGSVAAEAGFRTGDRIVAVDHEAVEDFGEFATLVRLRPEQLLTVRVDRERNILDVIARPQAVTFTDRFGNRSRVGRLGIAAEGSEMRQVPAAELPAEATGFAFGQLSIMAEALGQLVRGERPLDELGGPVKIAKITGEQASLGVLSLLFLAAALSLNLAFINLLPIPMLDGGHLLFYAVEAVRRRPVGPQVLEWAFRGGLALMLAFFLFVTVNDITSLVR